MAVKYTPTMGCVAPRGGGFPGFSSLRYEANHSLPSSARFKNVWPFTTLHLMPPYSLMAWCLYAQGQLYIYVGCQRSWDSVVGRLTMLWAGRCGVQIPAGMGEFFFYNISLSVQGPTQPPIKWVMGFFPRGKANGA